MGGASQATQEQQQVELQSSQQQMQFDSQLMNLFQTQYQNQTNTLNYLQGQLKPIIAGAEAGNGYNAATLAAMRTSATDQISSAYQNAQAALNQNNTSQMGGTNVLPSGVEQQEQAGLLNQEAQTKSSAQNTITLNNANLAQSNLWNGLSMMMGGTVQAFNPLGYANAATSGTGAVANAGSAQASLQNSITQANANSFFGKLSSSFASSLGSGFGVMGSGGYSNSNGGLGGFLGL